MGFSETIKTSIGGDEYYTPENAVEMILPVIRKHGSWHVERRKARHERYLLRKRAKEIAFEEAAQKLAKEIMNEKK